jgi:hypothetical protein
LYPTSTISFATGFFQFHHLYVLYSVKYILFNQWSANYDLFQSYSFRFRLLFFHFIRLTCIFNKSILFRQISSADYLWPFVLWFKFKSTKESMLSTIKSFMPPLLADCQSYFHCINCNSGLRLIVHYVSELSSPSILLCLKKLFKKQNVFKIPLPENLTALNRRRIGLWAQTIVRKKRPNLLSYSTFFKNH